MGKAKGPGVARSGATHLPEWSEAPNARGHLVQVYGGSFPAADVARFLAAGHDAGEACLMIATKAHRKAILRHLGRRSRCLHLDAERTLASILSGGKPDRQRFMDIVGKAVEEAAILGNGGVRAFGEMVTLLAQAGDQDGAARLEHFWNALGQRHRIALLCSYAVAAATPLPTALHAAHTHRLGKAAARVSPDVT